MYLGLNDFIINSLQNISNSRLYLGIIAPNTVLDQLYSTSINGLYFLFNNKWTKIHL